MATISIRLKDDILEEIDERSRKLHMPRAEYIRQAVIAMNEKVDREFRKERMKEASRRVREESMCINAEFDAIEDAPDV